MRPRAAVKIRGNGLKDRTVAAKKLKKNRWAGRRSTSANLNYDGPNESFWSIDPNGNRVRDTVASTRPFRCIQNPTN